LHEFRDVVHDKARSYKGLLQELKDRDQEVEVVTDEPSLRGNYLSSSITKNNHGCIIEQSIYDNEYAETIVTAPEDSYTFDFTQQAEHLMRATEFHKDLEQKNDEKTIYTCDNREPAGTPASLFAVFPVFAADISEENPTATYEGKCFEEITFEYKSMSDTQFEVLVHTRKPKSILCSDVLFFANTEIAHVEPLFWRGTHKITFNMKDA